MKTFCLQMAVAYMDYNGKLELCHVVYIVPISVSVPRRLNKPKQLLIVCFDIGNLAAVRTVLVTGNRRQRHLSEI